MNPLQSIADNAEKDADTAAAAAGPKTPAATSTPGAPPPPKSTPSPRVKTTPYHELEKRATAAGAALEEVQKEFDVYRTEKCENERMLNEELRALRESLSESRAKAIKLASQVRIV